MQRGVVDDVDAAVVGVASRVVVQIDAGEDPPAGHGLHHLGHEGMLRGLGQLAARPDTVVVRLPGEVTQPLGRGGDVAEEQAHGPRQVQPAVAADVVGQQAAYGLPADALVAVQQDADEQRGLSLSGEVDQCGAAEEVCQVPGLGLQQAIR